MSQFYLLNDNKDLVIVSVEVWARNFESQDRHVKDTITGDFRVSTVFLGLDHNFGNTGKPLLFETMVFGKTKDVGVFSMSESYCERYSTYQEALLGHNKIFNMVVNGEIKLKHKTFKLNLKTKKEQY